METVYQNVPYAVRNFSSSFKHTTVTYMRIHNHNWQNLMMANKSTKRLTFLCHFVYGTIMQQ